MTSSLVFLGSWMVKASWALIEDDKKKSTASHVVPFRRKIGVTHYVQNKLFTIDTMSITMADMSCDLLELVHVDPQQMALLIGVLDPCGRLPETQATLLQHVSGITSGDVLSGGVNPQHLLRYIDALCDRCLLVRFW